MGPLAGIKIVELAGIGPGPMAAMLLADLGATVLRIERRQTADLGIERPLKYNLLLRNRPQIALDLKDPASVEVVLRLVDEAQVLIEGFRPGVAERLGLGPQVCLQRNPRLVYGRMTGWGQTGPLAQAAAHDINFIALTGALAAIGRNGGAPAVPLNLVGDYGGGSLYLTLGLLAGVLEARQSGQGQVVDAAVVDGAASLMTSWYGMLAAERMTTERGTNTSDSGAPFYDSYECADGRYVSVGPIEARFYAQLLDLLHIDPASLGKQSDRAAWPAIRATLAARFKTRTRDEWCAQLEGTDVCFAPVLTMLEAPRHAHIAARQTLIEIDGIMQPAPAPRFSRTVPDVPRPPQAVTQENTDAALSAWLGANAPAELRAAGLID